MLKFHGYFKEGAIVQRNAPVVIKGYSNKDVLVSLSGKNYTSSLVAKSQDGMFVAAFPPVSDCSDKYILTASTSDQKISVSLLFGDVYITAGQSNMSYSLNSVENQKEWINRAKKYNISILSLNEKPVSDICEIVRPSTPQQDFINDNDWVFRCENFNNVSAISVQTAVILAKEKKVPIGIIHTAMGGLGIEAYLVREQVESDEQFLNYLKQSGRYVSKENYNSAGARNYSQLEGVWNEKITPLFGYSFSGFIWYLGESSAYDYNYGVMFERGMQYLIKEVKKQFSNLKFVCVQIAPEYYPYGDKYGYSYVNEALANIEDQFEGVFSVPIYDIEPRWNLNNGELYFHPIHTTNKDLVSYRIAKALINDFHFPKIVKTWRVESKIICEVKSEKPLKKGKVNGFTIADEKGVYYPANATVIGAKKVEVFSSEVKNPTTVTYAFMQYQDFCNLKDIDENPVFAYRTTSEPVNQNYFFTPAFLTAGASEVYENNFGWQVGTCQKRKVWQKGKIYDASDCSVVVKHSSIILEAMPSKQKFYLFGISPSVCLAGHEHYFYRFNYLNFELKANKLAQFLGVVFRTSSGEIYRFELLNGKAQESELPLLNEYRKVAINLKNGYRGDYSAIEFSEDMLKNIVEVEFLFRAKTKVKVYIKGLNFSSENKSVKGEVGKKEAIRADANLPT